MKISINTTYAFVRFNLNYGSVLQNYALQKFLSNRGHKASVVRDYRANPVLLLQRLTNIKYGKYFWKKLSAQRKQQHFIKTYMNVSESGYLTYRKLVNKCPDADCHIAGSDQIWRNCNISRYLSYVPNDKLKLSYAASFGQSRLSDGMKSCIQPLLERFDGLSAREKSGVDILEDMGLKGDLLLDPTLLLNNDSYPNKEPEDKEHFYYCYFLNLNQKKDVPFDSIKKYAAYQKRRLRITTPINYPMFLDEPLEFPSVEEWLGLYQTADAIFTNTYHGLLFCIIFRKQFLVCLQGNGGHPENERFYSILEILHLTDRLINPNDDEDTIATKMQARIDFDSVYSIIEDMRKDTVRYFERFGI